MSENGPVHLDEKLSRAQFEEMTKDSSSGPRRRSQRLPDAGIKLSDIDHVVLVGGSTRMPAVTQVSRS
jgi:molecular chaperone DnaK